MASEPKTEGTQPTPWLQGHRGRFWFSVWICSVCASGCQGPRWERNVSVLVKQPSAPTPVPGSSLAWHGTARHGTGTGIAGSCHPTGQGWLAGEGRGSCGGAAAHRHGFAWLLVPVSRPTPPRARVPAWPLHLPPRVPWDPTPAPACPGRVPLVPRWVRVPVPAEAPGPPGPPRRGGFPGCRAVTVLVP